MKAIFIALALFGCAITSSMAERVLVKPHVLKVKIDEENDRIVGGINDKKGEHGYQVSLQALSTSGSYWYHTCGGSIIGDDVILTAAHCVDSKPASQYRVVSGEYDLNVAEGTETYFNVKQLIIHPQWDEAAIDNDVALVKIQGKFTYNNFVKKINIATAATTPPVGAASIVTGWGYTKTDPIVRPNILQRLDVNRHTDSFWSWIFTSYRKATQISASIANGKGICNGDSGGPLVVKQSNGDYLQYGVCSYVFVPCGSGRADVYARVSTFHQWILANM